MPIFIVALLTSLRAALMPRAVLALENAALRQQLAVYRRTQRRPRLRPADRAFWILLRRLWPD
jgi:phosphoribosylcarboxyaminoimidazole (NCAIR) mutase